jgi:DNA-binding NarL/FixJ family response regulator
MTPPRPCDSSAATTTSSARPRVLLVDDHAGILERAAAALAPVCAVVGAVTSGPAAFDAVRELRPDVIVLDISMPGMNGFEVLSRLRAAESDVAVLLLSVHDDAAIVEAARAAGSLGFVLKRRLVPDLAIAVLEVIAGRPYFSAVRQ